MKIRFEPKGGEPVEIEYDPRDCPFGHDGLPGSILDVALHHGVAIEHQCGGNLACSTCHVIVRQGFDRIPDASDQEEDYLDRAEGLTPFSRLACQAVPRGDVTVEIPRHTRNVHFAPPPEA